MDSRIEQLERETRLQKRALFTAVAIGTVLVAPRMRFRRSVELSQSVNHLTTSDDAHEFDIYPEHTTFPQWSSASAERCLTGHEEVWWTPAEFCNNTDREVRDSSNLEADAPCARGDIRMPLQRGWDILRCGRRGAELRYFNTHTTRQCLDRLAARNGNSSLRMVMIGTSTLSKDFAIDYNESVLGVTFASNEKYSPHRIHLDRWNFVAPSRSANAWNTGIRNEKVSNTEVLNAKMEGRSPYDVYVIAVGAWDITWGTSAALFEDEVEAFVRRCMERNPRATIVLLSQTPEGHAILNNPTNPYGHDSRGVLKGMPDNTIELNKRVRSLAMKYARSATEGRVLFLDAHEMVVTHPLKSDPRFWEGRTGWHFNEPSVISHAIWMRLLHLICPYQ